MYSSNISNISNVVMSQIDFSMPKVMSSDIMIDKNITVMQIMVTEQQSTYGMPDELIRSFLLNYASEKLVDFIMERRVVDPQRLCKVIAWLEKSYSAKFGKPELGAFFDPEEGSVFLVVVFENCRWEDWKRLGREFVKKMKEMGLEDVASKVMVVCLGAFQEL